jgi:aminopeptidase N
VGRRLALAALVLVSVGCGEDVVDDGVEAPRPQPGVDVTHVRAEIALDPATLRLDATAALDVAHPDTLTRLRLGLDDALEVVTASVDGEPVLFWREADTLTVPLGRRADASRVEVAYRGVPAAGLYADEAAGQTVLYTDGWPDRTAGWLPTVHHPSDPATLDLTLDVPEAAEVVATGRAVGDSLAGGRRVARFVLDAPAPPYTWAFAVGDFTVTEQDGPVPIRHALLAADAALAARLDRTPEVIETLAAVLGRYPYETYATVQVPMAYAGMENATASFLRADLYGARAEGRNPIEEVNIHEVVHQWWGNAVVPADWRDLWLSEGAATYLTTEVYARLDGPTAGRRFRTLMAREISPNDAARRLVPATYDDPGDVLSATVYQKGGAVFHLIRLTIGDTAFFEALRQIQRDYADRPLSTRGFQAALEAEAGRDLGPLFERWVWGEGVPTLRTRWDAPTRTLSWSIAGDAGTLAGVPFELYVRQGDRSWFVPATDGVFTPDGDARPAVEPVGVLLTVERD